MNGESKLKTYMGFLWFIHNNLQNGSEPNRVLSLVSAFRDHFDYPEGTDWNGGLRPYGHCTLTIPRGCKKELRNELAMLNISRETLFPGLDSAADAITDLYSLRRQSSEL